jgi:hypothetical protein
MAKKKSRVPTPPKRTVQAPKPYQASRDPRRTRMILIAVGAALLIAAAGAGHVTELPKGFKYNSFPPTSGPHDAQWVIWNVYDKPVPQINLVHNLEHGGVAVQYGSQVPKATVDQIVAWYSEDPTGIVVAPLPALGKRIALTAWTAEYDGDPAADPSSRITHSEGRLAMCPTFDEDAFSTFRDDYRYNGVERFAPEHLQPGT